VATDDAVAVYFDADVDRQELDWIVPFMSRAWTYTLGVYGSMGPGRLYVIFHAGRYEGCHEDTHFSPLHDGRNVIDCGFKATDTVEFKKFQSSHLLANVVEAAAAGKSGSPAFPLWGNSKWAEFYQYDLYRALGDQAEVDHLYGLWTADGWSDPFPVAGTHWFRDWFYPLWRDRGGAVLMAQFFSTLAQSFPSTGDTYARALTWGEFILFMSRAARQDLKPLATTAFGWPADWEAQYQAARAAFPQLTY
jgi:hypothetical protein